MVEEAFVQTLGTEFRVRERWRRALLYKALVLQSMMHPVDSWTVSDVRVGSPTAGIVASRASKAVGGVPLLMPREKDLRLGRRRRELSHDAAVT
ncbi:hypothetical protein ONE63_009625 [Megalurothrips usitatus]|uniref:Uncharacterized protein n=1 Tax=Megalurothrips usitatus TaxID=439358 RepID=A0AAV7XF95_9NEOP|nr:hypothetical protein ONE63_009625 [Megalurothrips usitatus]